MNIDHYRGVFVAAVTPFLADGNVDTDTLARLTEHYIREGINGIFVLSSTGEYFAMDAEKRITAVKTVVAAAKGRIPVLTMVSDACLETVLSNSFQMAQLGVDGVVLTAPYYFKYSQEELFAFFTKAAEESPVPVLLYNQPTRLPSVLEEELVLRLSRHPNILGLKDTCADRQRVCRLAAAFRDREDFLYYAGSESLAGDAALWGANYVYALAGIQPSHFVNMLAWGREGNTQALQEGQERVNDLCRLFRVMGGGSAESFNNFAAALKAALELQGFGKAYTAQLGRLPAPEEYAAIKQILENGYGTKNTL